MKQFLLHGALKCAVDRNRLIRKNVLNLSPSSSTIGKPFSSHSALVFLSNGIHHDYVVEIFKN